MRPAPGKDAFCYGRLAAEAGLAGAPVDLEELEKSALLSFRIDIRMSARSSLVDGTSEDILNRHRQCLEIDRFQGLNPARGMDLT